jgi:hydrogenase maturation factor
MNLHYGQIVDIFDDDGLLTGRISVGGALKRIPLQLVSEARPGDHVLVCDGVAISRVNDELNLEDSNVSGHTG